MSSTSPAVSGLPEPSNQRIAIRLAAPAERAVKGGHPWVFADGIQQQNRAGSAGDIAVIFDRKGRFLAVGLYDPDSPIRVRVLHHGSPAKIDGQWFAHRLAEAAERRASLEAAGTNGYRLVHGENDGFPALIVDKYGLTYVIKLYSAAWLPHLRSVLQALTGQEQPERVVLRISRGMSRDPSQLYGLSDGMVLQGPPLQGPVHFLENGLRFESDVLLGQKTGFFLDQRDNRAEVEKLAAGRNVLNVFSYTGGFSLYAARGGALEVTSLDASKPAQAAAQRNFALNQGNAAVAAAVHQLLTGDAFELMNQLAEEGARFQMVIIDPPSFAKKKSEIDRAIASYRRLVRLGIDLLQRGGTLVMASCSSRVDADTFFDLIHTEARACGRPIQEIKRTSHALDHPITFPEGRYLKCLFGRVP